MRKPAGYSRCKRLFRGAASTPGDAAPRNGKGFSMSSSNSGLRRADYGLDAPGVIRNLLLVAAAGIVIAITQWLGLWSSQTALAPLLYTGMGAGVMCLVMAGWMVWGSKVGKLRNRDRLLSTIPWRGDEQVLDVGC